MDQENHFFNDFALTNADIIGNDNAETDQTESPQEIICQLTSELTKANAEILQLKAKLNEYEVTSGIVNKKSELLKLLLQKDNTIERKSMEIKMLKQQLEADVSAKVDALIRLDGNGGNDVTDLAHSFMNNETELMDEHPKRGRKRNKNQNQKGQKQQKSQKNSDNKKDQIATSGRKRSRNLEAKSPQRLDQRNSVANKSDHVRSLKISNESLSIQNELLSVMRTRRQSQFVLDAFSKRGDSEPIDTVNEGFMSKTTCKNAPVQKPTKSSKKNKMPNPFVKLSKIKLDD